MIDFDDEFASPRQFADFYRSLGIQAVPALRPAEATTDNPHWKRPAIRWREHTQEQVTDDVSEQWWHDHPTANIGMLTGAASGGLFILDLDTSRHIEAERWWEQLLTAHNGGRQLDTPTQRTGGGGLQLLLRAPHDWRPPTGKTPIGVDVRGEGGFAMLPPSAHESGNQYRWLADYEPGALQPLVAPLWLCEAIDALLAAHRGTATASGGQPAEKTPTPDYQRSLAGDLMDGREGYMTQMVWARVVDLYRDSPIQPSDTSDALRKAFDNYASHTKSRLTEPGIPNHILLEREGRGITAFKQRWDYALTKWDGEVAQAAGLPSPSQQKRLQQPVMVGETRIDPETGEVLDTEFGPSAVVSAGPSGYRALNPAEIYALPDPEWLVDGLIIERGMGFIYGKPGAGKSFVALDIALRVATAKADWMGKPIVKTGGVVYISSEGVADMKFRLKAWGIANAVELDQSPFYLIPDAVNFMNTQDLERLFTTLDTVIGRTGEIVLVVVDTVSRVLPGADENLQKDMTVFIAAIDGIRERYGVATIGVHHTSREGNLRGSTVFDGAGDFLLSVEKAEDAPRGVLHATKIKAAADGWRLDYELSLTAIGDLKGTQSLVAGRAQTDAPPGAPQHAPLPVSGWPERRVINAILTAMDAAWSAGKPWTNSAATKLEGRFSIANIMQFGVKREIAESLLERWSKDGIIAIEMHDRKSRKLGLKVVKAPPTTNGDFG